MSNSMTGFPEVSGALGAVSTKFRVSVEVEAVEVVLAGVPVVVETAPDPVVLAVVAVADVRVIVPLQSVLTV
jgi:hypothetical protein